MNPHIHKAEFKEKRDEDVLAASWKHPYLFEILVERYEEAFLRKARSIVHHDEAARDIVQDTFVKIYLYGKKFKPVEGARFSSWAYKVLMNVCFHWYKKMKREREFFSALDEDMEAVLPHDDREERAQKLDRDYLESMFARLPETFARILRLYVSEGKDYKEIAEVEGVTEGAVKTRMHRARAEMRKIAEDITY
ncbi:MAG TPA: RNA polymerase sigma factor [Candidatus Paceibacterota bacterium]|nr:RNA polymerase sigma factor [Candidatus Paceibacterota bacterium]